MSKAMLLDLNTWIDYYMGYRARHEDARKLVIECIRRGIGLYIPASCLGDLFYLCQHDFKAGFLNAKGAVGQDEALAAREAAWAIIANVIEVATVVGADVSDAEIALKYKVLHADYEDDTVLAAVLRSGADCLVTSDEQLRRHSPIQALSPAEALEFFGLGG